MKDRLAFILIKIQLSLKTIGWILRKKRYVAVSVIAAVLFFELIYWSLNLSVLITIIFSNNVTLIEKIAVLISPIQSIISTNGVWFLIIMILLAAVQGVSLAMIIYVVRHQRKIDDKLIGGNSFAALLAIIGLGCPSCGTSLLTPVVALFASGSAVAISETIAIFVFPFALIVGLFSLYSIGLKAANIRAHQMY